MVGLQGKTLVGIDDLGGKPTIFGNIQLAVKAPENRPKPKIRKGSSSNHPVDKLWLEDEVEICFEICFWGPTCMNIHPLGSMYGLYLPTFG